MICYFPFRHNPKLDYFDSKKRKCTNSNRKEEESVKLLINAMIFKKQKEEKLPGSARPEIEVKICNNNRKLK